LVVNRVLASAFLPADYLAGCFRHYLFTSKRVSNLRITIAAKYQSGHAPKFSHRETASSFLHLPPFSVIVSAHSLATLRLSKRAWRSEPFN
jgi:hypothetical protein